MNITLEADYAVRIVYCLALAGQRMDARSVAEKTGVTLRFSLKILGKLVGTGLIRSFRGAQGGYELAVPADEITLRQVIETVEGDLVLNRCLSGGDFVCTQAGYPCVFQPVFNEINNMIVEKLDSVTIGSVIRDGEGCGCGCGEA